jgi:predicted AAA+ superfamily ATPase
VQGLQGTGKSTLIALLYKRIAETMNEADGIVPLLIDFHAVDEKTAINDLNVVSNFVKGRHSNFVMFVDGIDEYSLFGK